MALEPWLVLPVPSSKAREGGNANRSLHGLSQWLSVVWDNLSCLNLCVHSHSVCQHLNLVVTSRTCPKNTIESRVHFVIPRSTLCADTLGSDLKEIQGTACLLFLSNGKPRSWSIGTALQCPDTAPQPILYAQGCRKPPLCSCVRPGRNETVGWVSVFTWALC